MSLLVPTRAPRVSRPAPVLALLVVLVLCLAAGAPRTAAAATTSFDLVYSKNTTGNVLIAGNSSMTCPTSDSTCTTARRVAGGGSGSSSYINNNYVMGYVNSDTSTAGIFNSSSATVGLPGGSTVLFAALVWSSTTTVGEGGATAPGPDDRFKVKLKVPGSGSYTTVASSRSSTINSYFQGYADVTSLVSGAGAGSYTLANIQAATGKGSHAGWALAVAYSDPTAPLRNLSVFSGFAAVSSSNGTVDVGVSGFTTPPNGAVRTTVGAVAWEGDTGIPGDQLLLGPDASHLTNLSDPLHAATNVFDSVISTAGTDPKTRDPAYSNNLGVDAATISANGLLPNGSSSAVVRFITTSDGYYPGLMTFVTDLYAPRIDLVKTAAVTKAAGNLQSQSLEPGDTITYTINGTNTGSDDAAPTVLTDPVPSGTTYRPGSLKVGGVAVTDAGGDDLGRFTSSDNKVTAQLGAGATPTAGGSVAVGASIPSVVFSVVVDPVSSSSSITNTARIDYSGVTTGQTVYGASNTLLAVAYQRRSDLGIALTGDPGPVQRGAGTDVSYRATVTNGGPYDEPAAVLHDVLPPGATVVSTRPSNGTCTTESGALTCQLFTLASGASATVDVVLRLDSAARTSVSNATVSGTNADPVSGNNSAAVATLVNGAPTASGDAVTTSDGSATLDPAANDTDDDPDTLRVTSVGTSDRGSAVLRADGTVTYTAAAGQAGTDRFAYTVSDGHGGAATSTVTVTIPNTAPVARPDAISTTPHAAVDVDVLANDADVNIPTVRSQSLSVTSFTQPTAGAGEVVRSASQLRFTPSAGFTSGSTTFGYTVSDGAAGTDTTTVTVTMADVAPVAADDTASTSYHTPVDVDVLANDSDDNGDTLDISDVSGAEHGVATAVGGHIHYRPDAGWSGVDGLTYTITDGTHSSTAHLEVTTGNGAPHADGIALEVPGGRASALDVLAHASDPNGDTLTIAGAGPATHGSVTVSDGSVHYDPDPAYRGPDSFTYTVDDGNGGSDEGTVSLVVANQAPTAVDDAAPVPGGGSTAIDVRANDTDPNGDVLTVTAVEQPSHGTAVLNAAGGITYSPDAGYAGADTFGYTVDDGHGGRAQGTVTVTTANQSPVANEDRVRHEQTVGSSLVVDALANDTDPNGDRLHLVGVAPTSVHGGTVSIAGDRVRYTPDPTFAGEDRFTYTVGDPRGGLATGTVVVAVVDRRPVAVDDLVTAARTGPTSVDVLANDTDPDREALTLSSVDPTSVYGGTVASSGGKAVYTPAPGHLGPDSFTYVVSDPRGGTAIGTVSVDVVNAAPTAGDFAVDVPSSQTSSIGVLAHAQDADADSLSVTVGLPDHGTLSVDGGTVHYTPEPGFHGRDAFDYTVSDGHGGAATGTVDVTVGDQRPVTGDDTVTHQQAVGSPLTVDVLANDTDPDADPLTVTSVSRSAHGTTSLEAGVVRYTPDAAWVGDDTFAYTISDGHEGVDHGTVVVHVLNRAPAAVDDTVTAQTGATTIDVLANDSDPDGEVLTVSSVGGAAHGTTSLRANVVRYIPDHGYDGPDSFTYVVSDPRGGIATATVQVAPADPAHAPTPAPDAVSSTGQVGTPLTIDVLANDNDLDQGPLQLVSVGDAAHGTVLIVRGQLQYTPDVLFAGTDTFTYTVTNSSGLTATAIVSVTVVNHAPHATDDHLRAVSGRATLVRVLPNDTESDGEELSVSSFEARSLNGGSVFLQDGSLVYTSKVGFTGVDTFTYTVTDPRGATASATVRVRVRAAAGSSTPDPEQTSTAPTSSSTAPSTATLASAGGPAAWLVWAGLVGVVGGTVLIGRARRRPGGRL